MHYQNQIITVSHKGVNNMSIKGLLFRFFLSYWALLVIAGLVMGNFGIMGGSAIKTGILAGLVCWVCISFGQKNRRYFTKNEKFEAMVGIITIDLLLQLVLAIVAASGSSSETGVGLLVFTLIFTGIFHALVTYYFVDLSKKLLIKQKVIISV